MIHVDGFVAPPPADAEGQTEVMKATEGGVVEIGR